MGKEGALVVPQRQEDGLLGCRRRDPRSGLPRPGEAGRRVIGVEVSGFEPPTSSLRTKSTLWKESHPAGGVNTKGPLTCGYTKRLASAVPFDGVASSEICEQSVSSEWQE